MLSNTDTARVYLACGSTDMRKSIDGLAAIVTHVFQIDLFTNTLFVFCNSSRDKIKILYWDCNGFWLYYRRLERGRFQWPQDPKQQGHAITRRQLLWLLDGLSLQRQQAHAPVGAHIAG